MMHDSTPGRFQQMIRTATRQKRLACVSLIAICWMAFTSVSRGELSEGVPAELGMRADVLERIDAVVEQGIQAQKMPGCVVIVGRQGKIALRRAYGFRSLEPERIPMTVDTVFDLASLTKPIATATSVMRLWELGHLRLGDRVSAHLPEFAGNGKEEITVLQLLTHQAGLTPDNELQDYQHGRAEAWKRITQLSLVHPPGERFVYSDVGFIVLGELVERLTGKGLDQFARDEIFIPMGMHDTMFRPTEELKNRAAVTEQREGRWMQGEVHDPRAYLMEGVAGHAGLFSTADDLSLYAQTMLNGGRWNNRPVLSPLTVQRMTEDVSIIEDHRTTWRGLGWDKRSGYSSNRGENWTPSAFGHGGFTGTVIWIDPELDLFVIFLSNRVHPRGEGSVNPLAGTIGTIAATAITDLQATSDPADDTHMSSPAGLTEPHSHAVLPDVLTGLDVLARTNFELLRGQRIGLITNHTGVDRKGTTNIRLLREANHVDLRAIFSPEHGIAGTFDQPKVADERDAITGLTVFSLYGDSRKPTANQLAEIDTLVFDIQDIGCRFYTYLSTMSLALEAAAEQGKRFIVLDRPNPINGMAAEGPLLDAGKESFVGYHTIPIRHGMTAGELARMLVAEKGWQVDLVVVPVENWRRALMFDETGLPWVNPSPNMRSVNQAILYPGVGLLETTNLSVGRGTDTPFELFGAPWLDSQVVVRKLYALSLPGVRFTPRRFTPSSSTFAGESCHGVQIAISDRGQVRPCELGFAIASVLKQQHADQWQISDYGRLLGNDHVFAALQSGTSLEEIWRLSRSDGEAFLKRRQPFLLY